MEKWEQFKELGSDQNPNPEASARSRREQESREQRDVRKGTTARGNEKQ